MRRSATLQIAAAVAAVVFVASQCTAQQLPRPQPPRPGAAPAQVQPIRPAPGLAQAPPAPAPPPPPVVLRVNGQPVTQDEVTRFAWTRMGKKVILDIVDETLIVQEARKRGIGVTPAEIDKRIGELAELAGGRDKLISERGVAGIEALRAQIRAELLLAKLVEQTGRVSEQQARAYYEAHKDDFAAPERLHLYEIVTDNNEAAYNARSRLAQGESFATVAAQVSIAASAQRGGEVGWVTLDAVEPEALRRTVATLQVGQVSMPLFVDGKFHIVMVAEKQPGQAKAFEEVKDEIISLLREQRGATPRGVLMRLRRAATVEVLVPPFEYVERELAQAKQIKVVVEGKPLALAQPPVLLPNGKIIVPAKPVFAAMGCRVQWIPQTKRLVISRDDISVAATEGSDEARVDGKSIGLGEKVQIRAGTVWVPPRSIAEAFGFSVAWDPVEYVLRFDSRRAEK
ncbi:MAG: peptidyl-prolyl cis-trans isomerase [Armatimonadetes bacterium]|nr:peptidyl-prolyl cis-trans isomerase [Armatimonadota bacterium]